MVSLRGKVVLVTGSTSGIGAGIAEEYARAGADIVLNGLGNAAEIENVRAEMANKHGVRVAFLGTDMSNAEAVRGMVEQAEREMGRLDILVNNAGIQYTARVEEFPADRWDAVIAINLSAAFHAMAASIPYMRSRGYGRIINVASVHGVVASVEKAAYVASKFAIVGLTKVAALENAGSGVTVNAICPGWVLTPLVRKQIEDRAAKEGKSFDESQRELLMEKQPSGQFVTPKQLGELAVFLAGDATSQMTGQSLIMDGGWTSQ